MRSGGVIFARSPVVIQGGDGVWSISDGAQVFQLREESGRLDVYARLDAARQIGAAAPRSARPAVTLVSDLDGQPEAWTPQFDLLGSEGDKPEFVVEMEHDGTAYLRFGDDIYGKRPNAGTSFVATYRVGNGTAGNIGAESLAHIVTGDGRLLGVSNPLPASGGVEPESAEAVRRDAPASFRVQERAVTQEDYAELTQRLPSVQRAAATFRWTGSWNTAFLTVDRQGGGEIDPAYETKIRGHVDRYRMAGTDLEVDAPRFVSLEVALDVCVLPDYFRSQVKEALLRVFGRGWLPDGTRAFFHPDNFTFGQPVYLSDIYAAAQAVPGVKSVVVETFQRLLAPDSRPIEDAALPMGRLEIARLDNDQNFPERGLLSVSARDGK
jgi:predicted phage baseplate assembly protein